MRHRLKTSKLSRDQDHTQALIRNLATSLVLYEKIKTTKAKAKIIKPFVEKLINMAKKKDAVNAIRKLNSVFFDDNASRKIMENIKKRYEDRSSGYIRVVPLGFRKSDAAPLVQVELV